MFRSAHHAHPVGSLLRFASSRCLPSYRAEGCTRLALGGPALLARSLAFPTRCAPEIDATTRAAACDPRQAGELECRTCCHTLRVGGPVTRPSSLRRRGWCAYALGTTTIRSACRWTRCCILSRRRSRIGASAGSQMGPVPTRPWLRRDKEADLVGEAEVVDLGSRALLPGRCVIYLIDTTEVPDFNTMYELYDPCTVMFFYRNKVRATEGLRGYRAAVVPSVRAWVGFRVHACWGRARAWRSGCGAGWFMRQLACRLAAHHDRLGHG